MEYELNVVSINSLCGILVVREMLFPSVGELDFWNVHRLLYHT